MYIVGGKKGFSLRQVDVNHWRNGRVSHALECVLLEFFIVLLHCIAALFLISLSLSLSLSLFEMPLN
jgi:hypothetical protein